VEIARVPAVVENDVLVQLAELVVSPWTHLNISRQASIAATSRSISVSSL